MPQQKIALLIDAENIPVRHIDKVFAELNKRGEATIRRAYGNWAGPGLQDWRAKLHEHAIVPVQNFSLTAGKNAADMALIVDAMEMLYCKPVDEFCVVSSDCDFTPLVFRLIENGKPVMGIGEPKAPLGFQRACSRFVSLVDSPAQADMVTSNVTTLPVKSAPSAQQPELQPVPKTVAIQTPQPVKDPQAIPAKAKPASKLPSMPVQAAQPAKPSQAAKVKAQPANTKITPQSPMTAKTESVNKDKQLIAILSEGIKSNVDDLGWTDISVVGQHLRKHGGKAAAKHGFVKLGSMLKAISSFDVQKVKGKYMVRMANQKTKAAKK